MTAVLVTLASVVGVLLALLLAELVRDAARVRTVAATGPRPEPLDGAHPAVLVFLTSTCTTCRDLWAALATRRGDLPSDTSVIAVTRGEEVEDGRRVRRLAPRGLTVRMSTELWDRFGVTEAPYVVRTSGSGTVVAEGTVQGWDDVVVISRTRAEVP
jgi:hypothetical protein